jgi:hypothetical protein
MIRKILKITAIILVVAFIIGQFIRPDFTNPPVIQAETLQASTEVPADVQQILTRSCTDCHSNETKYPWYSKITPSNWFLKDHIDEGRRELNFSVWNTYKPEKKLKKLDELCEQVELGEMPLPSYLWLHRDAVMAEGDAARLCEWSKAEQAKINGSNPK